MDRSEIFELLDHYFNGPPSEEDRQKIEQYRKDDPGFEDAFREYERNVQGIREFRRAELKADLKQHLRSQLAKESKEPIQSPKIRKIRRFQWRSIAAVALLFIFAAGAYRYQTRFDRWYKDFKLDEISSVQAGNFSDFDSQLMFDESVLNYTEGTRLAKKESTQLQAIEKLQSIPAEIDYYYFWAQFEIALIYLERGEEENAKKQLQFIMEADGEHVAKERAAELYNKLQYSWGLLN